MQDGELLPQREVLGDEARAGTEGGDNRAGECPEKCKHRRTLPERDGGVSRKSGLAAPRSQRPEHLVEVAGPRLANVLHPVYI